MKNISILWFFLFISFFNSLYAQKDSLLRIEIDQQIWYPFMEAYKDWDAEAFNAIHDKDMLRGSPWGLSTGEEYFAKNIKRFEKGKISGDSRQISFSFEYRVHEKDMAYEVGYYKLVSKKENKENVYYGQFHVVLKKINGQWKIVQDWDANKINGETVGEVHFMKYAEKELYELE